jgi:glycogen debranching enzyme
LAYLKVHGYSAKACHWVREHAKTLEHHFYQEDGLWAISENFDGSDPGPGKGCIQQAWSVGMTLLALLRAET